MGKWTLAWCVAALALWSASIVAAQTATCADNSLYVPTATGSGDPCAGRSYVTLENGVYRWINESPFASPGWQSLAWGYGPDSETGILALPWVYSGSETVVPIGFRLNRSHLAAPTPGDFLPVGKNLAEHSTCLLPPGGEAVSTDWQGAFRPTLNGKVDLVTGLPLIQVTDLELPFGGATFRLHRTRSGLRLDNLPQLGTQQWISAPDQWWDWAGMGWMLSENPLLVIESALPDVTGDQPYTSYFIVDAHHSIPFQLIEATGVYEAPPRFRARMTHSGGQWGVIETDDNGKSVYGWVTRPTQYDVYLYEGALHYTFVAMWEDVPPKKWNSAILGGGGSWEDSRDGYHDRPLIPPLPNGTWNDPFGINDNPGWGLPYFGLCTKIEDKHGHSVEIEYCDVISSAMDDENTGCTECQHRTFQKGQIRSIKLKDGSTVKWTLVYAHRMFAGLRTDPLGIYALVERYDHGEPDWGGGSPPGNEFGYEWVEDQYTDIDPQDPEYKPEYFELHGHAAVDRIYAFKGDIDAGLLDLVEPYLSISHSDTGSLDDSGVEPLEAYNANRDPEEPALTGWAYKVRYYYDVNPNTGRPLSPPLLIRTDTITTHASGGSPSVRHRVFQYDLSQNGGLWSSWDSVYYDDPDRWGEQEKYHQPWLRYIFEHEGLLQLREDWNDSDAWGAGQTLDGLFDLNALGRNRSSDGDAFGSESGEADIGILSPYASVEYSAGLYWTWGSGASPDYPDIDCLRDGAAQQIFLEQTHLLKHDLAFPLVHDVSFTDGDGVRRHYRVNRLAHVRTGSGFVAEFRPVNATQLWNMRSAFAHPYYWQTYKWDASHPSDLVEEVTLHEARWVAILDEYISRETLKDENANYGTSDYSIRAGQSSRRVVEMNPTGYVLRDLRWEFTPDGVLLSGAGLGEQFRYMSAEDYFTEVVGTPLPAVPEPDENGYVDDPWALVRNEALLVQHRSVGWSAGWLGNDPSNEIPEDLKGLVRFFDYEFNADTGTFDFEAWPASSRVYLVAEGIQQGTGEGQLSVDKHYTRQVMRDVDRPMDVAAQVEFTSSDSPLLETIPDPYGEPVVPGVVVRQYRTEWEDPHPGSDPPTPQTEYRAASRMVIGAPRQQHPGPDWYYPLEIEIYDDDGNSKWSASGLVLDPLSPNFTDPDEFESLIFTYYERDPDFGASKFTVVDAVAGATGVFSSSGAEVTSLAGEPWPPAFGLEGWKRIGSGAAYNAVTEFRYHDEFGLVDIYTPNHRRWSKRVVIKEIGNTGQWQGGSGGVMLKYAREYIFNDLYTSGDLSANGPFSIGSPGEVNDYPGDRPIGAATQRRRVMFDDAESGALYLPSHGVDEGPGGGTPFTEYWRMEIALDANGRPQEATLLEPDINGAMIAVGSKMFNDLGEVTREQEIDGSVTRVTKNQIGFALRTYVGTSDEGWVDVENGPDPEDGAYNMVLMDRTEYGLGLHDAWQPTVVRQYRSEPAWSRNHHGAVDPSADGGSFATATSYDWRMRPVRTDSYDRGVYDPDDDVNPTVPPRLSTTVTYLDHADRPRLIVTFGAGQLTLGTLDPTELTTAEAVPDPKVFYNVGIAPISVVEMEYGSDGTMTVRKSYDVAWYHGDGSGDVPFQAEHQYAGMGGQVVYSERPSEPITRNVLDSFGRVLRSISILPGTQRQLARTDYFYDDDGNVKETWQWTRVKDDAVDELSGGNAVRTRSVSWYDKQKRLIATADLGTERPENDWVFNDTGTYSYGDAPTWSESGGVERKGVPPSAQLWIYVYDVYGNQTHVVDPKGIVTEYEYTPTGRMSRKIENAAATPAGQRATTYGHEWGRVTSMAMTRTVGDIGFDGETQHSRVIYVDEDTDGPCDENDPEQQGCEDSREGAEVVDELFQVVTRNNAAVKWLALFGATDPGTDPAPGTADLTFRYTFNGQVAERIDARGVSFRYWYDALGRTDSIEVGHYPPGDYSVGNWAAGYPASMDGPNGQAPADRIGYVEYFYDAAGRLSEVKTYAARLSGSPITHNKYDYDERGQILADWQAQGAAIDPVTTPHTAYAWEYLATDPENSTTQPGHHRLASMTYPTHDGSTPRMVDLKYGALESSDDLLSRIASIENNFGTAEIASFEYVGVARRSRTALAGGEIAQSFTLSTEVGLAGLDMFGRTKLLEFTNSLGDRLFSARYGYDANSNRVAAEISQYESQSTPNVRSQFNHYDDLNRLVGTDVGSILWTNGVPSLDPNSVVRSDEWNLDLLGNWSGGSVAGSQGAGRESWGNLDGFYTDYALPDADSSPDTWSFTQDVNDLNELTGILLRDEDAGQDLRDDGPIYDAAGSLIFDGNYYFQYDAWNRLVQVNEASLDGTGQVVMGDLLKHFMFDGLGRLVRTQTPTVPGGTNLKTERFYYDGLRRIQEFVTNPITTLGGATGDPTLEALASQTVPPESNPDEQTAPAAYEEGQLLLGGGGGSAGIVAREYVWGPGDNGFDELLVQYNSAGHEAWAIQDAGGDLVAMCDLGADDGLGNPVARVVGQWTYDAYGEVLTAEYLESFAHPKLGHKGLFLDRLDGTPSSPRLVPYAHSIYHMRNRTYAPGLGRFLQRDPNATAMALVEATAMHGKGLGSLSLAFDLEGLYGDGGNLYEYLGSSPWDRGDVLGLSWDPFDMVDEYLIEDAGSKAAFIDKAIGYWHTVAYLGAYIAAASPCPITMVLGEVAMAAMGEPDTAFWHGFKAAEQELAQLSHLIGGIHLAAIETAVAYVQHHGSNGTPGGVVPGGLSSQGAQVASAGGLGALLMGGVAVGVLTEPTHVYVGKNGNGDVVYVGITNDFQRRRKEHGARFVRMQQITTKPIPRIQAMAIETALIDRHKRGGGLLNLENKYRSISPRRALAGFATDFAFDWIMQNARYLW